MKNITPGSKAGGTASANGPAKPANKKWTPPALIENPLIAPPAKVTLSGDETAELERLEKVVAEGKDNFLKVGHALIEIRDKKLYRDEFSTFEQYFRERFDLSKTYAYNLIGSTEVYDDLSSIEDLKLNPVNEAQLRELIQVPAAKRVEAWKKAVEVAGEKPPTAKIIHQAAAKFKPKKSGEKSKAVKKAAAARKINIGPGLKLIGDAVKLAEKNQALMRKLLALRKWLQQF